MLLAWSQVRAFGLACCLCLLVCLPRVMPVAQHADVVDCGRFAWPPLCEVGSFEVRGLCTARVVSHHPCALPPVSGQGGFPDPGRYMLGAVVIPDHGAPFCTSS